MGPPLLNENSEHASKMIARIMIVRTKFSGTMIQSMVVEIKYGSERLFA